MVSLDWSMEFNATFSCIVAVKIILVEETGVAGENRRPVASNWLSRSWNKKIKRADKFLPEVYGTTLL
jgi:hypothetical protein